MTDDLDAALAAHPADQEAAVTVTPSKPRPHRHVWERAVFGPDGAVGWPAGSFQLEAGDEVADYCWKCRCRRDPERSRRGRLNRQRGLAKQRQANRILGITNIAGNAPNHDGGRHDELFASESKSGAAFSRRYWRWLTDIPTLAGQIPVLVVADAPGPGRPTRRMVIVRAEDWRDLHGGTPHDAWRSSPDSGGP